MTPPKPLLIVKTGSTVPGERERYGDFEDWFRLGMGRSAAQAPVVSVHLGEALPEPETLAGAVVTGSPSMATDAADWSVRTERWLARAVEGGLPVLAVCYGHQILARALGGAAGWNPNGREIGTVPIQLTEAAREDPLFAGLPNPLFAQNTHSQSVTALPPGARLLGHNAHDSYQAFAFGPCAWSVQFHPEFDAQTLHGYLTDRADEIRAEGLDPQAIAAELRETPEATSLLSRFATLCG